MFERYPEIVSPPLPGSDKATAVVGVFFHRPHEYRGYAIPVFFVILNHEQTVKPYRKTINALQKLSAEKVAEVSDLTEFIIQRSEDKEITSGIGPCIDRC